MKRILFLLPILELSINAYATSQYGVEIVNLNINRAISQVFVRTSTAPVSSGCHIDTNWNYTFKISTEADKAAYSTMLAAKIAGKIVNVVGYGDCFAESGGTIEELKWITLPN